MASYVTAAAAQPSRPARTQPSHLTQSRKHRPRSFAMSQERRPRYERFADKHLELPRHPASRSPSPAYSTASSEYSSASSARDSASSRTTDFDDLYDVSDDDSAVVPLKISNSVKQLLSKSDIKRESLPSLVIPSPSAWPTIEKMQSAKAEPVPPLPTKLPLSPQALAKLTTQHLRVPAVNSTPSLDGSLTSDEAASISPSTPDLRSRADDVDWDMPVQLTNQAMDTLQHLSPEFASVELGPIIEVPETQSSEMQERGLNINLIAPQQSPPRATKRVSSSEPVSAISVPSPGGFFSSLNGTAQTTWSWGQVKPDEPSTTTAECFYDVPWNQHMDQVKEQVIEAADGTESEGPPTARQENFAISQSDEPQTLVIKKNRQYEYDEEYERKLHQTAASNMSRTSMWLSAQEQYLSVLKGSNPLNESSSPVSTSAPNELKSPVESTATSCKGIFSPKKAVRFAEKPKTPVTAIRAPESQQSTAGQSDSLFYLAFQHLSTHSRSQDAHKLRHLRADAIQAQRAHITASHRTQLRGQYAVPAPVKPAKDFGHLPSAPNDPATQRQREEVARVDRERKALQQLNLSCWNMEATKFLSGGSLLPRAASDAIAAAKANGRTPRVLDLGGLPTADWGWATALEHRDAKVYTAVVEPLKQDANSENNKGETHWSHHRCPSNHRTLTVSTPYSLPFPTGSFDVVSARTLHALCRTAKATDVQSPTSTSPPSAGGFDDITLPFAVDFSGANRGALTNPPAKKSSEYTDEYAASLAEIRRVLAPGGVLAYEFMDAEVSPARQPRTDSGAAVAQGPAGKALHARSVEFAVALRQMNYDPCAGRQTMPRLAEAGFKKADVSENWIELPVGGEEDGVGAISEVVGGIKWERWMLATRGEKGLEGVAKAMEEARRGKKVQWSWRWCVGVARNL